MNQMYYETETTMQRKSRQDAKTTIWSNKKMIGIATVLLWVLLAAAAFSLVYYFIGGIQNQLEQIQRTNQANTAELNNKLTEMQNALNANAQQAETLKQQFSAVQSELNAVNEEMSLAGDSLSSTAETKKALNERITDLSKELEQLRASIQKLEEAARVY